MKSEPCPPAVEEAALEILYRAAVIIRVAGWQGDADYCALEAHHIHNLPGLIRSYSNERLNYYLRLERAVYLYHLREKPRDWAPEYGAEWALMEEFWDGIDPDAERPYERKELATALDSLPPRGVLCPNCGLRVPQFSEVTEAEAARFRLMARQSVVRTIRQFHVQTGAPMSWAKLWVHHASCFCPEEPETPCPFCGEPLRTAKSRQCRHCKRDWHDPKNLRWLGVRPDSA